MNHLNPFVQLDPSQAELESALRELEVLESEIKTRKMLGEPMYYGLPDLTFPIGMQQGTFNRKTGEIERKPLSKKETNGEYEERQNEAMRDFLENMMQFERDGRTIKPIMIHEQLRFVCDLFYKRVKRAILWKARGCGGSLMAAILLWLDMIYNKRSGRDMGGSLAQARIVYNYVTKFWSMFPGMKTNLISGQPRLYLTELITGVSLECIPASEKKARGEHKPVLVMDESCQEGRTIDDVFLAAMNAVMSEPEHMIVALSTFHVPVGFFADLWDFADEKGFVRYGWNCFESMEKCTAGLETATPSDPLAIESFCRKKCPLTERVEEIDKLGNPVGIRYDLCDGQARTSNGWMTREQALNAYTINMGTEVFRVEFACQRPQYSGPIYGLKPINDAVLDEIVIDNPDDLIEETNPERHAVVGIDWGISLEGCMILMIPNDDHLAIVDCVFLSQKLLREWVKQLHDWQDEWGHLEVYADSSHPFNNGDLEDQGFDVTEVEFSTVKDYGISNLSKLFIHGRIKILSDHDKLLTQLKQYHRDPVSGKIVKKNDHGPDALLAATVTFDCMELWPLSGREIELLKEYELELEEKEEGQETVKDNREKDVDSSGTVLLF